MNLVERLLTIDKGELSKVPVEKMRARKLSELMGEDVEITVTAICGERYTELSSGMVSEDGTVDFGKLYETNALIAAEGIVEPNLKNEQLQKHFGCATPKELVKVLFPGGELSKIADKITDLSGFSDGTKNEKKVKNS